MKTDFRGDKASSATVADSITDTTEREREEKVERERERQRGGLWTKQFR